MKRSEERALLRAIKSGDEAIEELIKEWVAWTRCWRGPQSERKSREAFEYLNERAKGVSGYRMTTPEPTIPQQWYVAVIGRREDLDRVVGLRIWDDSEDWEPDAGLVRALRLRRLRTAAEALGEPTLHITRSYGDRTRIDQHGGVG